MILLIPLLWGFSLISYMPQLIMTTTKSSPPASRCRARPLKLFLRLTMIQRSSRALAIGRWRLVSTRRQRIPRSRLRPIKAVAGDGDDFAESGELVKDLEDKSGEYVKKVNKGKKEKIEKGPRFTFLTKTEMDNLEDGYRWRKYGQKAVKNSPFPRGYYKCIVQNCNVKKRIERSREDLCFVVTTYEGKHNHYCPITLRGPNGARVLPSSASQLLLPGFAPTNFFSSEMYERGDLHQQYYKAPDFGLL